jgi:hypothetical protein
MRRNIVRNKFYLFIFTDAAVRNVRLIAYSCFHTSTSFLPQIVTSEDRPETYAHKYFMLQSVWSKEQTNAQAQ